MSYNEYLVEYLSFYPDTAVIAVPVEKLVEVGTVPGVTVIGHDAYYNEYRAADGTVLARVLFPVN